MVLVAEAHANVISCQCFHRLITLRRTDLHSQRHISLGTSENDLGRSSGTVEELLDGWIHPRVGKTLAQRSRADGLHIHKIREMPARTQGQEAVESMAFSPMICIGLCGCSSATRYLKINMILITLVSLEGVGKF